VSVIIGNEAGESLVLDATISENYDPQIIVTEHPMEDGASVGDGAVAKNMPFTVTGVVTDTPFAGAVGAGERDRALKAVEFLKRNEGAPLSVLSQRLGFLTNCLLTRYPHSVTQLKSLTFEIGFKQVRIAETLSVPIPPRKPAPRARDPFASAKDAGKQALGALKDSFVNGFLKGDLEAAAERMDAREAAAAEQQREDNRSYLAELADGDLF